jgi:hypothetical protein
MTDDEFFNQLRDCSLPSAAFNHRGHVRLAWICLQRFEREQAVDTACDMIAAYAASLGAADKFHRTLSEALMRLSWARRRLDWPAFEQASTQLGADLERCYSCDLLASAAARERFVAPDLAPLPA